MRGSEKGINFGDEKKFFFIFMQILKVKMNMVLVVYVEKIESWKYCFIDNI